MRIFSIFCSILFSAVLCTSVASAQTVSGEVGIISSYLDDNNLVYSDGPHLQISYDVELSDTWTVSAWGSHGTNSTGSELDVGISKSFNIDSTSVTVRAQHFFLQDSPDINAIYVLAARGPLEVEVAYYQWRREDVTRVSMKYSVSISDAFTLRPQVVYETEGFGARNVTGGIGAYYGFTKSMSLRGLILYDGQTTQSTLGLFVSF